MNNSGESSVSTMRLDSLTGLRFFAALVVFLSHAAVLVRSDAPGLVGVVAEQGFVGVSFFYILSGFVLTWSHREGDTPGAFYRRRFARIAPNYWVCLVLGVLYAAYAAGDLIGTVKDSLPSVVGLQAWFPMETVYYGGNPVGWSISVEVFFYALFPLLVLATRQWRKLVVLGALGAAVLVATPLVLRPEMSVHDTSFWAVYIFPVQRLGEFAMGMALAAAMRRGWRTNVSVPAAALLAVGAYFVAGVTPFWAAVSIVTVVPFCLLIASAASADSEARPSIFRRPALVRLGEWSFAFYLVHFLVVACTRSAIERSPAAIEELGGIGWFAALFALVASVFAAAVLYGFVEHPMERKLRHARPRLSDVDA